MNARTVMAAALCLALAGCSGGHMQHLRQFVAHADAGFKPPVKPVPNIAPPKIVAFSMHHFIDPFEPFAMRLPGHGPNPYRNVPKGPLQRYALAELKMVGTLRAGPAFWAIVATPTGSTHRVTVGMYMGRHYGKVVAITASKIRLVETVAGPAGWVKEPVTLGIE
ncbi:MAG: pilus assembly protein PilP [Acidiferrobacter sp.]